MNIVLYYGPNTCALAPYVTLTEAKAPFEVRPVNLGKKQQMTPDYLKLNPKHKVPVLTVDGRTLTENVAMQVWIARNFPDTKLLPSDPWQEMKAISLLAWCASGLHPYLARVNSPAKVSDLPAAEESVRRLATEELLAGFRIADDLLAGREFFFDHFTAADAHFFWVLRRAGQLKIDHSGFKNCTAYFNRLSERPSFKKVLDYDKKLLAEFAKAA
jgi:glutathione S-transferase